jgi:hypothetical protein
MNYRAKRTFDWTGGIKQAGEIVFIPNKREAEYMIAKGLIESHYQNKVEKIVPTINNKAYLVHDKGQMFFVKRAGEVIDRLTKKQAEALRDTLNGKT